MAEKTDQKMERHTCRASSTSIPSSFKQVKEIHSTAHWEAMRGTVDQAAEYCKRRCDWFEAGTKPLNQSEKGERGKPTIAERWALAKAGEYEQLPPKTSKSTSTYMQCILQKTEMS